VQDTVLADAVQRVLDPVAALPAADAAVAAAAQPSPVAVDVLVAELLAELSVALVLPDALAIGVFGFPMWLLSRSLLLRISGKRFRSRIPTPQRATRHRLKRVWCR
jgi:hypothetical protein